VALSVRFRVAENVPVLFGLKVTLITQLEPAFSVVPQVVLDTEKRFASGPVILIDRLRSAPVPVLEIVSALVEFVFRLTAPKPRLVGLRLTVGEFTVCETVADVLLLKLLLPPYAAVSVLDPLVANVIEQLPVWVELSVPVQDSLVLAVMVTEPVGPAPPPATVKLIVTDCCRVEGFGVFEVILVVLAALVAFVDWLKGPAAV
jgi:hypothetical protein